MKTKNIFKAAAMMALVLFTSCSKEEIKDSQDNGLITLTVPAIQGFGDENAQSRTVFDFAPDDATPPKVKWEKDKDVIYIGKTSLDNAGQTLQSLIDKGDFIEFKCVNVDENNTATFQGKSLIEGSNVAVYTKIPDKVTAMKKTVSGVEYYGFQCDANAVAIKDDNTHLAENDLLVSDFNTTDKKLKFGRAFGLVKFELTLPEGISGTGTFSCDNFRLKARIYNQIDKNGYFSVDGHSETNFKVDNLIVGEDHKITFYSLVPFIKVLANNEIVYKFTIGEKTYSATASYTSVVRINVNKATKISATLTEQLAQ